MDRRQCDNAGCRNPATIEERARFICSEHALADLKKKDARK